MGWDATSQTLTTPATDADMQAALSCYTNNAGDFFNPSLAYINPMAKNKPIRFDKTGELDPEERRGNDQDKIDGYFFGVKFSGSFGKIPPLHDVTFDYRYPRGSAYGEWFRLMDFNGYVRNAQATISCAMAESGSPTEVGVYVDFSYNTAGGGIDYAEVIAREGYDLKNCYLCMLLSNTSRTSNYACALRSSDDGQIHTVYYNGRYLTLWYADFAHFYSDGRGGTTPLAPGTYYVTLFLYIREGLGDTFPDLNGGWSDLAADPTYLGRGFAIPKSVKKTFTIIAGQSIEVGFIATRGRTATVNFKFAQAYEGSKTVTATLVSNDGQGSISQTASFTSAQLTKSFTFNFPASGWWGDRYVEFKAGQTYNFTISLYADGGITGSKDFSMTF